jgi:hypothetical protein
MQLWQRFGSSADMSAGYYGKPKHSKSVQMQLWQLLMPWSSLLPLLLLKLLLNSSKTTL